MKITDLIEQKHLQDLYDSLKYDFMITTRLNYIKERIILNDDIAALCDDYLTVKKHLIKYTYEDQDLENKLEEVRSLLVANGGSQYLSEEKYENLYK